ncbi:cytochrome P450 [Corynebacterium sp. J010B-136]|nr:cytochrome P450 [Corynebacterium sp. J010B-136]
MDPREFADKALDAGKSVVVSGDEYIVVSHAEAVAVAHDPERFSSRVSAHLQIPNGLDGHEHATARALVDSYLASERVSRFLPQFHAAAQQVLDGASAPVGATDIGELARLYAVRAMQGWLQWPEHLTQRLLDWIQDNDRARVSGDRQWTKRVAEEFDAIIRIAVAEAPEGSETHLLATGHGLSHEEVVSILRNWTAGDLGSMARCIEVIAVAFANAPELQDRVRVILKPGEHGGQREFEAIADEILRNDNPFVSNRRVTTCPVDFGQTHIPQGTRVHIHWTGANRDPKVFEGFDPQGHAKDNLVWGTGPHYCPGKALSMAELRAFWTEALARCEVVAVDEDGARLEGVRSANGGWERSPARLVRRKTGGE